MHIMSFRVKGHKDENKASLNGCLKGIPDISGV